MGHVHPLENSHHVEGTQDVEELSINLHYSFNFQILQAISGHSFISTEEFPLCG